ncbi:Trypsin-like serine protease [Halocaridina rubra]|uniref:CLIP domain-containing serine protease n=1 Tax=Halocaridina rubra TaxID=373956 RepID=A0AAN9A461_HALRR
MRFLCLILLPAVVFAQGPRVSQQGHPIQFPTSHTQRPGRTHTNSKNVAANLLNLLISNRNDNIQLIEVGPTDLCSTPDGLLGVCGPLSECEFFIPYLEALQQPSVLQFFRGRVCRLKEFHFCCPRNVSQQARQTSRPILPSGDACIHRTNVRIVGGNEISPGSWPWLVTIGVPRADSTFFHYCGGTLVTAHHVLTAAHCFDPRIPEPTHVRLGEHHLGSDDDGTIPQEIKIRSRILYGFNNVTFENDIALITLEQDGTFNDFVRPACLPISQPERDSFFDGERLSVVGWGQTGFGIGRNSLVPREVHVPATPIDACRDLYQVDNLTVDDRNLCAGVLGRDSCQGDSGGPLNYVDEHTGRHYVVGIVSNGRLCGVFPGVYTRVGSFINWILGNIY